MVCVAHLSQLRLLWTLTARMEACWPSTALLRVAPREYTSNAASVCMCTYMLGVYRVWWWWDVRTEIQNRAYNTHSHITSRSLKYIYKSKICAKTRIHKYLVYTIIYNTHIYKFCKYLNTRENNIRGDWVGLPQQIHSLLPVALVVECPPRPASIRPVYRLYVLGIYIPVLDLLDVCRRAPENHDMKCSVCCIYILCR